MESGRSLGRGQTLITLEGLKKLGDELVRLCDSIERHGLVDYQYGVWEEQITESRSNHTRGAQNSPPADPGPNSHARVSRSLLPRRSGWGTSRGWLQSINLQTYIYHSMPSANTRSCAATHDGFPTLVVIRASCFFKLLSDWSTENWSSGTGRTHGVGSTRSDICGTRTCFRRRVRTGARWAAKGWKWFPYLEGVRQLAWSTGLVGVWNNGYDREQHSDDKSRKPEKRQNRPQSEIAHRLSRAPTGGNITVAKCTNTVSFLSLPCLVLLENKN